MIDERNPLRQAPREQMEADQQQMLRCQRGEHDMLATDRQPWHGDLPRVPVVRLDAATWCQCGRVCQTRWRGPLASATPAHG